MNLLLLQISGVMVAGSIVTMVAKLSVSGVIEPFDDLEQLA